MTDEPATPRPGGSVPEPCPRCGCDGTIEGRGRHDLLAAAKAVLDWLTKPATYPAEFVRIKKQLESAIARAEQPDTKEG